jgi:hypothetical protein
MVDIPRLKVCDPIFAAVAKVNGYLLITSDKEMIEVSKKCGIRALEPKEFLTELREGA